MQPCQLHKNATATKEKRVKKIREKRKEEKDENKERKRCGVDFQNLPAQEGGVKRKVV